MRYPQKNEIYLLGQWHPAAFFIRDAMRHRVGNPKGYKTIAGAHRVCLPNVRGSLRPLLESAQVWASIGEKSPGVILYSVKIEPVDEAVWLEVRRKFNFSTPEAAERMYKTEAYLERLTA